MQKYFWLWFSMKSMSCQHLFRSGRGDASPASPVSAPGCKPTKMSSGFIICSYSISFTFCYVQTGIIIFFPSCWSASPWTPLVLASFTDSFGVSGLSALIVSSKVIFQRAHVEFVPMTDIRCKFCSILIAFAYQIVLFLSFRPMVANIWVVIRE